MPQLTTRAWLRASPVLAVLLFGLMPSGVSGELSWEDYPRVLSSERILVTVVATVNRFQIIVFVYNPKGYLLLTARAPLSMNLGYAQVLALEKSFLIYDKTGQREVAYEFVPPIGYLWQIPLKSVQPWTMSSS